MPIRVEHAPNFGVVGRAAGYAGAAEAARRERERRQQIALQREALAERARQFDVGLGADLFQRGQAMQQQAGLAEMEDARMRDAAAAAIQGRQADAEMQRQFEQQQQGRLFEQQQQIQQQKWMQDNTIFGMSPTQTARLASLQQEWEKINADQGLEPQMKEMLHDEISTEMASINPGPMLKPQGPQTWDEGVAAGRIRRLTKEKDGADGWAHQDSKGDWTVQPDRQEKDETQKLEQAAKVEADRLWQKEDHHWLDNELKRQQAIVQHKVDLAKLTHKVKKKDAEGVEAEVDEPVYTDPAEIDRIAQAAFPPTPRPVKPGEPPPAPPVGARNIWQGEQPRMGEPPVQEAPPAAPPVNGQPAQLPVAQQPDIPVLPQLDWGLPDIPKPQAGAAPPVQPAATKPGQGGGPVSPAPLPVPPIAKMRVDEISEAMLDEIEPESREFAAPLAIQLAQMMKQYKSITDMPQAAIAKFLSLQVELAKFSRREMMDPGTERPMGIRATRKFKSKHPEVARQAHMA